VPLVQPKHPLAADAPLSIVTRIENLTREQAAVSRAIDAGRDRTMDAYCTRLVQAQPEQGGASIRHLFAEGDSWFNHPPGEAIIDQLDELLGIPIANFARPDLESRQLLALDERREIQKRLNEGPAPGKRFDVLLFSGGVDDILRDQLCLYLNHYETGLPALNDRFEEHLDLVMGGYRDLVALRDRLSPDTLIVGHVYDFAQPSGVGTRWGGPWLRPSLDYVGVPRGKQPLVVRDVLTRFARRLEALARGAKNFVIVPTQGTLGPHEWANELRLTKSGSHKIALKFRDALLPYLGRSSAAKARIVASGSAGVAASITPSAGCAVQSLG
jgi:hypothetical protein